MTGAVGNLTGAIGDATGAGIAGTRVGACTGLFVVMGGDTGTLGDFVLVS